LSGPTDYLETEIDKRSDRAKGASTPLDRRTDDCLAQPLPTARKGGKNLNRKALAFLRLASILLMLRKLCNPV